MPGKPIRSSRAYLGLVRISRDATLGRNLTVAGRSDLQGGTTVTNGLTVDDLTVTGTVILPPLTFSDLTITNTLTVGGATVLNGGATVVGGLTTDLVTVSGLAELDGGATVDGGLAADSLEVSGDTHLDTLTTADDADIRGALTVKNQTTMSDLAMSGFLDVSTIVSSATTIPLSANFLYILTSSTSLVAQLPLAVAAGRWYRIIPFYEGSTGGTTLATWSLAAPADHGMMLFESNGTPVTVAANQVVSNIKVVLLDVYFSGASLGWIAAQRVNNDIIVT
jgi:hypothetical protein